jgi:hypothetical protein
VKNSPMGSIDPTGNHTECAIGDYVCRANNHDTSDERKDSLKDDIGEYGVEIEGDYTWQELEALLQGMRDIGAKYNSQFTCSVQQSCMSEAEAFRTMFGHKKIIVHFCGERPCPKWDSGMYHDIDNDGNDIIYVNNWRNGEKSGISKDLDHVKYNFVHELGHIYYERKGITAIVVRVLH